MDYKIKCLYLAFLQPKTADGHKARFRYVRDFLTCEDAFDFCNKFVRPGNYFYGEYMSYRTKELKSKINI